MVAGAVPLRISCDSNTRRYITFVSVGLLLGKNKGSSALVAGEPAFGLAEVLVPYLTIVVHL